jgi:hypothetical protein
LNVETKPKAATASKPRPPPLPINISPAIEPITIVTDSSQSTGQQIQPLGLNSGSAKPSVQQLTLVVQQLDITEKQKDKLEEFLLCREKIGDLTNDDLTVEGELGAGNGGVVLKVRHKKTGTVMAKKVLFLHSVFGLC